MSRMILQFSLDRAQIAAQAAMKEAMRRGWQMSITVYDCGGNLVTFLRMDGALLASIEIAQQKARTQ
jgi:glc operon protein GlcG